MAFLTRRRLRQLEAAELENKELHKQTWLLSHQVLSERAEKALLQQARERSDADAGYWKTRAELFLDQIGCRTGIIGQPTMTDAPAPTESHLDTVFAALGQSEINREHVPAPVAASAAPTVEGVNPQAAQAAIDAVLSGATGSAARG